MIRLIGRNTVEEIILKRAEDKLKLTDEVIEKGEFDLVEPSTSRQSPTKDAGQVSIAWDWSLLIEKSGSVMFHPQLVTKDAGHFSMT